MLCPNLVPFGLKLRPVACRKHTHTYIHTDFSVPWYTIIPTYFYTYTANLPKHTPILSLTTYLPRTQLSCTNFTHLTRPLTNVLLPSASRRKKYSTPYKIIKKKCDFNLLQDCPCIFCHLRNFIRRNNEIG